MLKKPKKIVIVASNAELMNQHYKRRLTMAIKGLGISREKFREILTMSIYRSDIKVLQSNGLPYPLAEFDKVVPDMRNLSNHLNNPSIIPRMIEQWRYFDLYFRIEKPHISRHFGR